VTNSVLDNRERSRYETEINEQVVFANYRRDGAMLAITYVEAPPALRGTGAASRLMRRMMAFDRASCAALQLRRRLAPPSPRVR
jgi:predicted GNAT family acetyltransferase